MTIYNNSGDTVELVLPGSVKSLANQESILIGDRNGAISLQEITWKKQPDGMRYPTLRVSSAGSITEYLISRPDLDDRYVGDSVCHAHLKIQLDPGQKAYFIPASEGFPVALHDRKVPVPEGSD